MACNENLLIELVKEQPILYSKSHPERKSTIKKDRVWRDIALQLGVDRDFAERRWINLRERFSKEVRYGKRQWHFFENLQFMQNHIIQRPSRQKLRSLPSTSISSDASPIPAIKPITTSVSSIRSQPVDIDEPDFIIKLIKTVEMHRELYDKRYTNLNASKEDVWSEIAAQCGGTSENCVYKWRIVRERFVRELKKIGFSDGTVLHSPSKWPYFEHMLFLKDFVVHRPRRSKAKYLRLHSDEKTFFAEETLDDGITLFNEETLQDNNEIIFDEVMEEVILPSSHKLQLEFETSTPFEYENVEGSTEEHTTSNSTTQESFKFNAEMTLICENLESMSKKVDKVIKKITEPPSLTAVSANLSAMSILLDDLPQDLQDKFLLEAYQKLMALRAEARSRQLIS